jgi:hypothetical protein
MSNMNTNQTETLTAAGNKNSQWILMKRLPLNINSIQVRCNFFSPSKNFFEASVWSMIVNFHLQKNIPGVDSHSFLYHEIATTKKKQTFQSAMCPYVVNLHNPYLSPISIKGLQCFPLHKF